MRKMMVLILTTGLLSGCASVSVRRDYDESVDFSAFKTFAWQHMEQPSTGDPRIDNDLRDERVRSAVNATLMAKGFLPGAPADADILVGYFIDYQRKLSSGMVSVGLGSGGYGRYGGVGYNTGITEYEQGNLTIDIIDARTEKTIWRGVGSRVVYSGSNPKKATSIVNGAVGQILKKFPPQTR